MSSGSDPSTWELPRISIDADGIWCHDGVEITHAGVLDALRNRLRVDAAGHYLDAGAVRVPVEVAAAPFVVVRAEVGAAGVVLTLNDGFREPLDPGTLALTAAGVPWCRVKSGTFEARWSRGATWTLLQHMRLDPGSDRPVLTLAGETWWIPSRGE